LALVARTGTQLAQVIIFIAAARVLSPAEFGIFTLVLAAAIFLTRVSEAGTREFVMSWEGDTRTLDEVGTAALFSAFAALAAGLLAALLLDHIWELRLAALLLGLLAIWSFLATLSAAYSGMLVRQDRAAGHSIATILAEVAGLVVSLGGLFLGGGILALAAGKIAMQAIYLLHAVHLTKWLPRIAIGSDTAGELFAFSRHILANRIIAFLHIYSASFLIGLFLGPASVGYYRAAERLASVFSDLLEEPARLVTWVTLRNALRQRESGADAKRRLGKTATVLIPLFLLIAAPVFIGLALVSEALVVLLLGEQWRPAGIVTAILAVVYFFFSISAFNEPLLSLTGEIRRLPPVILMNAIVSIVFVMLLVPYGLTAVALGQLATATVSFSATVFLQSRYGGVSWTKIAAEAASAVPALAAMCLAVLWVDQTIPLSFTARLAAQIVTGAVVYVVLMLIIRPSLIQSFRSLGSPDI
jgi:O-antigen/teichoic acid export membrane protein